MTGHPGTSMDIAIIGMAGLYPGAPNAARLWENILAKFDAVREAPPSWRPERFLDPEADGSTNDKTYTNRGGFIEEFADFDPLEFGIMPRSVHGVDPEQFLALRLAQEALRDAGYGEGGFDRATTGVILGHGNYPHLGLASSVGHTMFIPTILEALREVLPGRSEEFWSALKAKLKGNLPPYGPDNCSGLVSNLLSGRIANRLDLMGPNYLVDGACSSGVLAVQAAARELQSGRSDLMLAGGVQANTSAGVFIMFSMLGALSKRGHLRPFDRKADGTLLGEGLGMLVLKRLADARRDGDRIYSVIKGIGLASDGKAQGMLTPRLEGEALAVHRAYESSAVDPASISLVEAHGTGTTVGDQTEVACLRQVFGERAAGIPDLAVGSVKSMISHTIPASAIAGLMKMSLALYEKVIPPTLCDELNPELGLEASRLYVNTEARPWVHGKVHPRRAGLNAFGFGGINTHVILEEAGDLTWSDADRPSLRRRAAHELLLFAAADHPALCREIREVLRDWETCEPRPALLDVAEHCRRRAGTGVGERLALMVSGDQDLVETLEKAIQRLESGETSAQAESEGFYYTGSPLGREGKLAFLIPGEGSQYVGMLADLNLWFPEVRRWFDEADRVFEANGLTPRLSQVLYPPSFLREDERQEMESRLWSMEVAVMSMVTANCGLYELFGSLGVRPDALVGHSTSQDLAMYAGLAAREQPMPTLDQAKRDMLAGWLPEDSLSGQVPRKSLLSVGALEVERVHRLADESGGELVVAMDNCPNQVVLCGEPDRVEEARGLLEAEGALCQPLPFDRAYHTPWYLSICEKLEEAMSPCEDVEFPVPVYSTTTTEPLPGNGEDRRRILIDQWSRPVRFRETIQRMYEDGVRVFLEIGPRGNLSAFVGDTLSGSAHRCLQADLPHRAGREQLLHTLAALWAEGVAMEPELLFRRREPRTFEEIRQQGEAASAKKQMKLDYRLPFVQLDDEDVASLRIDPPPASQQRNIESVPREPSGVEETMRAHFDLMNQFLSVQQQILGSAGEADLQPPEDHHE